jgi:Fic family protein
LESRENLVALTGIFWDATALNLNVMTQGGVEWAQARMRARLPEHIWSAAALEGNTFTLPEVQTLLDGVTVEGKKLEEQQQVLALQETFNFLDQLVASREFRLNRDTSDEFHSRVARHEAIESGHFRGRGAVTGGGNVRLSTGEVVEGLPAEHIMSRFNSVVDVVSSTPDARLAALIYFAAATRSQFYFDGNKRTARMMSSGLLLERGFDAVYIPFERRLEYNKCLDTLFTANDATPLMQFLASCAR